MCVFFWSDFGSTHCYSGALSSPRLGHTRTFHPLPAGRYRVELSTPGFTTTTAALTIIAGTTTRLSMGVGGTEADGQSLLAMISADGRYVSFNSDATNLVPNDTNGLADVFLRDMVAGTTTRVNEGVGGAEAVGGDSRWPVISHDGRYVTYESRASNLVPGGDTVSDVFTYDRVAGVTTKLSVGLAGAAPNDDSFAPAISSIGRHVGFYSRASNLVAGDTNGVADIFFHSECWVEEEAIGVGTAGTGGVVPALAVRSGPCSPGGWSVTIDDVVGGAFGLLFVGVGEKDQFPVFGGHLYVDVQLPHAWAPVLLPGTPGAPGAGALVLEGADLESLEVHSRIRPGEIPGPGD